MYSPRMGKPEISSYRMFPLEKDQDNTYRWWRTFSAALTDRTTPEAKHVRPLIRTRAFQAGQASETNSTVISRPARQV